MKILIMTTCYPPDTAIAAVRPYMLAKYLKQSGHEVTVLRSGLIQQSADRTLPQLEGVRVITYLGENSPAECFERENLVFQTKPTPRNQSRLFFLPETLRKPLARAYHTILSPYESFMFLKQFKDGRFLPMQKAIDRLSGEHFDVAFSTVGDIENIYGGEYAVSVFGCKWILDFRDPIEGFTPSNFFHPLAKKIQSRSVRKADLCTSVSDDLSRRLSLSAGGKQVHTIYNGYDPLVDTLQPSASPEKDVLSICYTGSIYASKQDFSPVLQALQCLKAQNKIALSKVRLHYAGNDFSYLYDAAKKAGVEEVLIDHGYLSRAEAAKIQQTSDLYTVLSWNTSAEKGVLTGKFYEGIRAGKPILSIINGNVPHSELSLLNEKYHYGFCYEICRKKEQFQQLCDYLENAYREKMSIGTVSYTPDPALESDFRYDTLAKKLESLCINLIQESNKCNGRT